MAFQSKVTPEQLAELKRRFLELPDMTHEKRARIIARDWTGLSEATLKSYSRACLQTSNKVFDLFLKGTVTWAVVEELCGWQKEDQDFIIDEYLQRKLTPEILRKIRRYRKENAWSYDECIGHATGKIDKNQPHEAASSRSIDKLLSEIADKGARWRAMVQQVIAMIGKEEASAGIHEALFVKVCLLRELIGTQYDYVNSRFNRYINIIRKNVQSGEMSSLSEKEIQEGDKNGDSAGTSETGLDREEGKSRQDGSPVPHSADET